MQQLLGTINWVRPHFSLPMHLLSPLFELLTKGKKPGDLMIVPSVIFATVERINNILNIQFVDQIPHRDCQISLLIFPTSKLPTGILGVLEQQKSIFY